MTSMMKGIEELVVYDEIYNEVRNGMKRGIVELGVGW